MPDSPYSTTPPPPVRAPYQPPVEPPRTPRTSGKAIASFILGLMGMVFWLFAGVPAIVLALTAKKDIRDDEALRGNTWATFGLLLGGLSFFVAPIILLIMIMGGGASQIDDDAYAQGNDRIVHLHLSGALTEAPQDSPFAAFGAQPTSFLGLLSTFGAIQDDETVVALVITLNGFSPSMAHMEELHHAIQGVVESGTDVYVHSEDAMMSMSTYIMLSSASHFNTVPTAFLNLSGLYGQGMYLKEGLEKIGLEADVVHIGDYKSAGETFMRNGPSDAAAEAQNWLMDGLYASSVSMLATALDKTDEEVRALIDAGPYTAETAEAKGLFDSSLYQDVLLATLREKYGDEIYIDNYYSSSGESHSSSPFAELFAEISDASGLSRADSIGLVFVEGNIMPGFGSGGAFSGNVRDALEQAAEDDSIKAVVMRINSPGGSVTASEVIWRAAQLVVKEKPLVVSMGNVAASGGYYVACGANAIFADATTITGSIGVVGGKLVTTGLWDELGINWHSYQRGANADWTSSAAPFSDHQRQQQIRQMDAAYITFKDHVREGRGDKLTQALESMAAGRVFTGTQALDLGLVDEIGGVEEAIEYAADLVDLGNDYEVRSIPHIKTLGELLEEEFFGGGGQGRPTDLSLVVKQPSPSVKDLTRFFGKQSENFPLLALLNTLEPERSQEIMRIVQYAEMLNAEGVLVMAPHVPIVH